MGYKTYNTLITYFADVCRLGHDKKNKIINFCFFLFYFSGKLKYKRSKKKTIFFVCLFRSLFFFFLLFTFGRKQERKEKWKKLFFYKIKHMRIKIKNNKSLLRKRILFWYPFFINIFSFHIYINICFVYYKWRKEKKIF